MRGEIYLLSQSFLILLSPGIMCRNNFAALSEMLSINILQRVVFKDHRIKQEKGNINHVSTAPPTGKRHHTCRFWVSFLHFAKCIHIQPCILNSRVLFCFSCKWYTVCLLILQITTPHYNLQSRQCYSIQLKLSKIMFLKKRRRHLVIYFLPYLDHITITFKMFGSSNLAMISFQCNVYCTPLSSGFV